MLLGVIVQLGAEELISRWRRDAGDRRVQQQMAAAVVARNPKVDESAYMAWLDDADTWLTLVGNLSRTDSSSADYADLRASLVPVIARGSMSPGEWEAGADELISLTLLMLPSSLERGDLMQAMVVRDVGDLKEGQGVLYDLVQSVSSQLSAARRLELAVALEPLAPPPEPDGVVERALLAQLVTDAILGLPDDRPTVVLTGEPGIGKSTLALQVIKRPEVMATYPEGCYWIEVGNQTAARDLADQLRPLSSNGGPLGDPARLLVADDVWFPDQLALIRLLIGPMTPLVVTSRMKGLGDGERSIEVGPLSEEQSTQMLLLGLADVDASTSAVGELAAGVGGWAVLARLVNGYLKLRVRQTGAVEESLRAAALLLADSGPGAFDAASSVPARRLEQTLAGSLGLLTEPMQRRFAELGALLQPAVTLSVLAALWDLPQHEAELTAMVLDDASLLQYDPVLGRVSIHSVLQQYLYNHHLEGFDHRRFSAALRNAASEDIYTLRYLPSHLSETADIESLFALLTADYLRTSRAQLGSSSALLSAAEALLNVSSKLASPAYLPEAANAAALFAELLAQESATLEESVELLAAGDLLEEAIESATYLPSFRQRALAFSKISVALRRGRDERRSSTILHEAYANASQITDGYERAVAWGAIAMEPLRRGSNRSDRGAIEGLLKGLESSSSLRYRPVLPKLHVTCSLAVTEPASY